METERLTLRRFSTKDWRDLHAYLSDPQVVRYEPYAPFTEEASRAEAARRAGDDAFWAVALRESGRLIGNVTLVPQAFETTELGYVFGAVYQGRGYATEAVRALVGHAFAGGAHRVVARCNPENERSWRLLERVGLLREGHLRRNIYFSRDAEGRPLWQDTYEYAALAGEWK